MQDPKTGSLAFVPEEVAKGNPDRVIRVGEIIKIKDMLYRVKSIIPPREIRLISLPRNFQGNGNA